MATTSKKKKKLPRGRPAGSPNKKSIAIAQAAMQAGITPIEVMLNTMRHLYNAALTSTVTDAKGGTVQRIDEEKLLQAVEVAGKAAPYVHPRLSQVEVAKGMTDDELDTLINRLVIEAGIDTGAAREITPAEAAPSSIIHEHSPTAITRSPRRTLLAPQLRGQPVSDTERQDV